MAALGRMYLAALKGLIAFCYAALIFAAFLAVFTRYVFGTTPPWSEEAARYLCIWVVFLTAALAIEVRAHIALDVVPLLLPRAARLVVTSACWLAVLGFLAVFLRESLNLLWMEKDQMTFGLGIPIKYVYCILPLSAVCMLISSVRAVCQFWHEEVRRSPK